MNTAFVSAVQLVPPDDGPDRRGYPWDLPAVAALSTPLRLNPRATIYLCTESGLEETDYEHTDPVRLTRSFLDSKERFLRQLFAD